VCLTSTVTDSIYSGYTMMPSAVTFAKLIPEDVESSMFAMLTGLINFSNLFASKELAVLINLYFGVYYDSEANNNLQEIWKLYCVQAACCIIPITLVWLLPTKDQVKAVQIRLAEQARLKEEASE
jgi:predicted membrane protein